MKYRYDIKDKAIIESITQEIVDHLPEWYGKGYTLASTSPVILSYVSCFMLRFRLNGPNRTSKAILVKIRRKYDMQTLYQAVESKDLHVKIPAEYQDLLALHNFFNDRDKHLGAIRPLQYLPKYFAIFMEEFTSQTLRELLLDRKTILGNKERVHNLAEAAFLTGRIIKLFHSQMHTYHEIEDPTGPIIEEVNILLNRLQSANRKPDSTAALLSQFLEKIDAIRDKKIIYTNIHGDMSCDNILYAKTDANRLCMIDVKTKHAAIYSDISLILIHPTIFRQQIFTFNLLFSKKLIRIYQEQILKGYFNIGEVDQDLINLFCAIKMLDKWILYEESISRAKGKKKAVYFFAAPVIRLHFSQGITSYLSNVKATGKLN